MPHGTVDSKSLGSQKKCGREEKEKLLFECEEMGAEMKELREHRGFSSSNYKAGWEADNKEDVRTGDRHSGLLIEKKNHKKS